MTTTEEGESQIGEEEYRIGKRRALWSFHSFLSNIRSCFAKRDIKIAPAPLEEPLMEPKLKKIASLVK
jgi:hypothetical protein